MYNERVRLFVCHRVRSRHWTQVRGAQPSRRLSTHSSWTAVWIGTSIHTYIESRCSSSVSLIQSLLVPSGRSPVVGARRLVVAGAVPRAVRPRPEMNPCPSPGYGHDSLNLLLNVPSSPSGSIVQCLCSRRPPRPLPWWRHLHRPRLPLARRCWRRTCWRCSSSTSTPSCRRSWSRDSSTSTTCRNRFSSIADSIIIQVLSHDFAL